MEAHVENRARFVLEVAAEISDAIGNDKTAIRLSPYGVFNEMPHYNEIDATYAHLARELDKIGIAYIHLVDHSSGGAPEVPLSIKENNPRCVQKYPHTFRRLHD